MLDTNAVIRLCSPHETPVLIAQLVHAGTVEILITHVQVDELARVDDPEQVVQRVLALLRVRARLVTTNVFVLDVSRFDLGRLGGDEDNAAYRRHVGDGDARNKHAEDALIAGAARAENATLVTLNRQDLNRFRRGQPTLHILDWAGFLAELAI